MIGASLKNIWIDSRPGGKIRRTFCSRPLDTVVAEDSQFIPRRKKRPPVTARRVCTKGPRAPCSWRVANWRIKNRPRETELFSPLIDEEHAQAGSRAVVKNKFKADLAIVGEFTNLQVVTAHKGSFVAGTRTRGKAAHGATPHLGKNAVTKGRIVDILETDYTRSCVVENINCLARRR